MHLYMFIEQKDGTQIQYVHVVRTNQNPHTPHRPGG